VTSLLDVEDFCCQLCGAPGGWPYCANGYPISCADVAEADNDMPDEATPPTIITGIGDLHSIAARGAEVSFDNKPGQFVITDVRECDGTSCDLTGRCAGLIGMDRLDAPTGHATVHIGINCGYREVAS
jgi:hypothetical protein